MLENLFFTRPTLLITGGAAGMLAGMRIPVYVNEKRWKRHLFLFVLVILACFIDYFLMDVLSFSTIAEPLLHLAFIFGAGVCLFDGKPAKSAYYTAWSYLFTSMCSQLLMPELSELANTVPFMCLKLLIYLVLILFGYAFSRYFMIKHIKYFDNKYSERQLLLLSGIVLVSAMIFADHHFLKWLIQLGSEEMADTDGNAMVGVFRVVYDLLCLAVMYAQNRLLRSAETERELASLQQLWHQNQLQYAQSRENIELINRKCHNLKYQIRALKQLENNDERNAQIAEMEKSVMIYDSAVKTGNKVLDTVLTEKMLFCEEHGIQLTCMADGSALEGIGSVDLYTMFGNAIDNAIECVMKYSDRSKRVIQVSVYPHQEMTMIRIRNYCETEPLFKDGLPVSTKGDDDFHGFGVKSIQTIAMKYDGILQCSWRDGSYILQILLSDHIKK